MWVRLTTDTGSPVFVNFKRLAAVRQPAEGGRGSRLAFGAGSVKPVRESFNTVFETLSGFPRTEAGLWIMLTNESGKPVAINFERARIVRPGPIGVGGSMVAFLPALSMYVQESIDSVGKLLRTQENAEARGAWVELHFEEDRCYWVNSALLAAVREGTMGTGGSFVTFQAGHEVWVREPATRVLKIISETRYSPQEEADSGY